MAGGYTAIDLSQLPPPNVIEPLDFEVIFRAALADLQYRWPEFSALVESDPVFKVVEAFAYRELIVRQSVNEAARSCMLAYAAGADLDNLAALFGVARLVLDHGNLQALPPVPPTFEADADLRRRVQLSLEGYSTAGPSGAYIYHALSASGDVLDASAISPAPGQVLVSVLSRDGNGAAPPELVNVVAEALGADDVRPLCDTVTVQSAAIVNYAIVATIYTLSGPDPATVLAAARDAAAAYAASQHRIGVDATLSGIYAALHQPGVARVDLVSPAANITISATQASWCTSITVESGGPA